MQGPRRSDGTAVRERADTRARRRACPAKVQPMTARHKQVVDDGDYDDGRHDGDDDLNDGPKWRIPVG